VTNTQIYNLFTFYFLYSGIDKSNQFPNMSPDYLLEKYEKIINVNIPSKKYPELLNINEYKIWNNTWSKSRVKLPDSLLMFVIETYNRNLPEFYPLRETFEKYIGSVDLISNTEYKHIHPLFKNLILNVMNNISVADIRQNHLEDILK